MYRSLRFFTLGDSHWVVVAYCSVTRIMLGGMLRFWNRFTSYDETCIRMTGAAYFVSPPFPGSRFEALPTRVFSVIVTTREQATRFTIYLYLAGIHHPLLTRSLLRLKE